MKIYVLLFFFVAATMSAQVQIYYDSAKQQEMLVGILNEKDLFHPLFKPYIDAFYDTYLPDAQIIEKIKSIPFDYNIKIILGTWCGDSQEQIPPFLKILHTIRFPSSNVTWIAVDRKKRPHANVSDYETLKIERIPTFIFFRNNQEMGRIVETPKASLEKDWLEILSK
ncbi:MAG: thioredoxin family protein [Bacteroidales bacterium]|nr:thioredoxin family protein [Bacteroidales bacterium]